MRRTKAPALTPHDAELNEILQYPNARTTFDDLCEKGMDRERLKVRLLWLRGWFGRKRTLSVNPEASRKLSKKLAALLRDIKDSDVGAWRRPRRMWGEKGAAIVSNFQGEIAFDFNFEKPPVVRFDLGLLLEQLRAGARYFARVGRIKKPVIYAFRVDDMPLRMLLNDVKTYTGGEHYKEIALLCTAATGGRRQVTEAALKMRVGRSGKK